MFKKKSGLFRKTPKNAENAGVLESGKMHCRWPQKKRKK